jgi:hypothetical protein
VTDWRLMKRNESHRFFPAAVIVDHVSLSERVHTPWDLELAALCRTQADQ